MRLLTNSWFVALYSNMAMLRWLGLLCSIASINIKAVIGPWTKRSATWIMLRKFGMPQHLHVPGSFSTFCEYSLSRCIRWALNVNAEKRNKVVSVGVYENEKSGLGKSLTSVEFTIYDSLAVVSRKETSDAHLVLHDVHCSAERTREIVSLEYTRRPAR
jgi:hypothetical protein